MSEAIAASGSELVTVALRRVDPASRGSLIDVLERAGVELLPNTAGCYTARDAVATVLRSWYAGGSAFRLCAGCAGATNSDWGADSLVDVVEASTLDDISQFGLLAGKAEADQPAEIPDGSGSDAQVVGRATRTVTGFGTVLARVVE